MQTIHLVRYSSITDKTGLSSFTPKIGKIMWNPEKIQIYSSSRSSKVFVLVNNGDNQNHNCNFLLVINSNYVCCISYYFQATDA